MAGITKKFCLITLIVAGLVLTACGDDNSTPMPGPSSPASSQPTATAISNNQPAPTATAAQPTSAPLPATPVAKNTPAGPTPTISDNITRVPVLPTTMPADPNLSKAVLSSLPTIKGARQINADLEGYNNVLRSTGYPGAVVQLYTSDDNPDSIINNTDSALATQGYKASVRPQSGKPGVYFKSGNPDISVNVSPIPANPNPSTFKGLTQAQNQQISAQIKGHKTLLVLLVAPNMIR